MKRLFSLNTLAAAGVAIGALAAASAAHARSDVFFSVGVQAPGVYVQPAPVYVQPRPVYVEPRHLHVQPRPVYGQPQPVYVQPRAVYEEHRYETHPGARGGYDWDGHRHGRRHGHRYGPYGDLDRDGIANQYDRDLDGDGVRNRRDRFPSDGYRW